MSNDLNLLILENQLPILTATTQIPNYDFDFRRYIPCRTPWERPKDELLTVARIGAFDDYEADYKRWVDEGVRLIHSPQQHFRCSQLPGWYPLIEDLTPRSQWFTERPEPGQIEQSFRWPVFVKGARQTSRHQRSLSIIHDPMQFQTAMAASLNDSILRWQPIVVREFVPLRRVEDIDESRIPTSFEFRTFWWRGQLVGAGRYWWEGRHYDWTDEERQAGLALAAEAARRVNVPFLVVDIAQSATGQWLVIECNDGQESGYAGVSPIALWQNIVQLEAN